MLQIFRDKIAQGWIAWVIVILIGVAFTFWGIEGLLLGGSSATDTVAKVNGYKISQNEVNNTYQRLSRQWLAQAGPSASLTPTIEKQLKQAALNQIITRYLLTQAAQKQGYRISEQQLDATLMSLPMFQENKRFSAQRFQQVLSGLSYSQADFINLLRNDLILNQVRSGIIQTTFTLPTDLEQAYSLISQQRDFGYTIIPLSRFTPKIHIDKKILQNYYEQHRNDFKTPEQVSIEYLELDMAQLQSSLKFDEKELKQYYQDNLDNFTQPAQWHVAQILIKVPKGADTKDTGKGQIEKAKAKINSIAKQLKQGADFSELAKKDSQDIVTAKKGGVLPWFSVGMIGPAFEKAVMQLKPGEVSQPVRTQYGFNIIKLLAMKKPQALPFEEVKQKVKTILAQQKAQKIFADQSDQLANLTFMNPDSLAPAAKALNLKVQTTDSFSRKGSKKGITAHANVIAAAFNPETLVQGNNSNSIEISPENVVVLRVKQHKPAATQSFSEVKENINQILTKKQAQQQAQKLAEKISQRFAKQKPENVVKAYDLTWHSETNIGRSDQKVNPVILTNTFKLAHPLSGKLSSKGFFLPSGDYVIIALADVRNGKLDALSKEQQKALKQQLAGSYGQLDYQLYIQQLKQNAKIEKK